MKSITLSFHGWRGFGRAEQGDFFVLSARLGFVTLHICRVCVIERLKQLKRLHTDAEQRRREIDQP